MKFLDREERGGNRRIFKHFNNKINKHKRKAKINKKQRSISVTVGTYAGKLTWFRAG